MKNWARRWNTWGLATETTSLVSSLAALTTGASNIARVWGQEGLEVEILLRLV
ncbi:hypothetical protein SLEP1_g13185 [Rubroshorea leprosula]|uniref:Uncharacterized protein n=1 Tax=Rubroshorea leprosula TaxID=152421 RepID=A0AAV5IKV8_9ROSI|nr:hypothetical protein SLEP1_g13185 [Rubroshorea leprosula]